MKFKPYQWFKDKYGDRCGNWPIKHEGEQVTLPLCVEMFLVQLGDSVGMKKVYYKRLKISMHP